MNSNNKDFYTSSGLSAFVNNHPIKFLTYSLGTLGMIFLASKVNSNGKNWLIGSFILAIIGFYLTKKMFLLRGLKIKILTEQLNNKIDDKAKILNAGKNGEHAVNAVIAILRNKMDFLSMDKTWMPSDDGISDIVIDNGPNNTSQEIDSLLVTQNKVFILEVKDWRGDIFFKNGVNNFNGIERKSPEIQTKSKIDKLYRVINKQQMDSIHNARVVDIAEIVPLYVFTHKDAILDPNLAFNFVSLAALPNFFALHRDNFSKSPNNNLKLITSKIKDVLDLSPDAKSNHMLKLTNVDNPTENALAFKKLHEEIPLLEVKIKLIDNSLKGRLKNKWLWAGVVLMAPFVAIVTIILIH